VSVPSSELGPHPFSCRRVCPPFPEPKGGTHSPAGEGVGGLNSDDLRKSLVLCLLSGCFHQEGSAGAMFTVQPLTRQNFNVPNFNRTFTSWSVQGISSGQSQAAAVFRHILLYETGPYRLNNRIGWRHNGWTYRGTGLLVKTGRILTKRRISWSNTVMNWLNRRTDRCYY
jgi:hypothetical protein